MGAWEEVDSMGNRIKFGSSFDYQSKLLLHVVDEVGCFPVGEGAEAEVARGIPSGLVGDGFDLGL